MLKALLVDDEKNVTEALSQMLALYHPEIEVCACCHTLASAVTAIKEHEPALVLLDIELGAESGFDLFTHFPQPRFKVIFVTAHQQYAVQAFRFAALDYLLKPVHSDLLAEAVKKTTETIDREKINLNIDSFLHNIKTSSKKDKKIILKTAESIHLVNLNDILYCEANGGYTNFYMADKTRIMVTTTMGTYEDLFEDSDFCRIHQTYLLNLAHFKRYDKTDGGMVVLKDGTKLPVATRKKDTLLQRLSTL